VKGGGSGGDNAVTGAMMVVEPWAVAHSDGGGGLAPEVTAAPMVDFKVSGLSGGRR
jgi:hypothetical protein